MCIHLCVLVRIPQRAKTPPTGIRYLKWCQCSPCEWCCIPASLFRERNLNGPIREITRKSRYLPTKRSRESLPKFSKRRRWRRAPSQRPQAESRSAVRTSFLPGAPSIPHARSTTQPGSELEGRPASTPHAARARVDVHSARSVGRSWQRQAAPARSVRLEATDATRTVERAVRCFGQSTPSESAATRAALGDASRPCKRAFSCTTAARAAAQAAVPGRTLGG